MLPSKPEQYSGTTANRLCKSPTTNISAHYSGNQIDIQVVQLFDLLLVAFKRH